MDVYCKNFNKENGECKIIEQIAFDDDFELDPGDEICPCHGIIVELSDTPTFDCDHSAPEGMTRREFVASLKTKAI
jgi:hypothetical protein